MKKLLLLLVIVMLFAGLMGCSGVIPPLENPFVGQWFNVDEFNNSITKIYIAEAGNSLAVEVWAKCDPEDCYWGKEIVDSNDTVNWVFSFAEKTQELMLLDDNNLLSTTFVHFIDGSGRPDYTSIGYFQK